jgi:hypothetical protein
MPGDVMANTFFDSNEHPKFASIVTGAHRNAAFRARPPMVVGHVGFWRPLSAIGAPQKGETSSKDLAEHKRQARRDGIDKYLRAIWAAIQAKGKVVPELTPNLVAGDLMLLCGRVNQEGTWCAEADCGVDLKPLQQVTLVFDWHMARVTLRLQQHIEYTTLTSIIDLSREPDDNATRSDHPGLNMLVDALEKLEEKIRAAKLSKSSTYKDLYETIYTKIWNVFYDDILVAAKEQEAELGPVFADFRGCVLGPPGESLDDDKGGFDLKTAFGLPFRRAQRQERRFSPGSGRGWSTFPPVAAPQIVENFWRFITVATDGVDFRQHEFTASRMIGGRAIYASSLGVQSLFLHTKQRVPVHYFVYCNTLNRWQIGRMIERICFLGCERLAAMVKFDELRDAGYQLQEVDAKLSEARDEYDRKVKDIDIKTQEADKLYGGAIDQLKLRIRLIDQDLQHAAVEVDKDLAYRIERSLNYIEQFRDGIRALRIERIEGYQPYDAFVERRLGPAFNLIAALDIQFKRIMYERNTLFQRSQEGQATLVEITTRNRNDEIQYLQKVADLALWGILVPYYLGDVLIDHVLGPAFDLIEPDEFHVWIYIVALSWLVGALSYVSRGYRSRDMNLTRVQAWALSFGLAAVPTIYIALDAMQRFFHVPVTAFWSSVWHAIF